MQNALPKAQFHIRIQLYGGMQPRKNSDGPSLACCAGKSHLWLEGQSGAYSRSYQAFGLLLWREQKATTAQCWDRAGVAPCDSFET
jgi:hypothetical protein